MSERSGVDINWTRSAGSALGAVSSAVLLSTLGVAGTLIGAALGSLIITVGGALYSSSLQATKERVLKTASRSNRAGTRGRDDPAAENASGTAPEVPAWQDTWAPLPVAQEPRREEPRRDAAQPDGSSADPTSTGTPWGQLLRDLPWKRIAGVAAALFVVSMALILVFELSTGRPVSSFTGGTSTTQTGTSVPGFDRRSGAGTDTEPDQQDPQQEEVPQEEAPQEAPPQEEAPQEEAPQEEAPQEAPPAAPAE